MMHWLSILQVHPTITITVESKKYHLVRFTKMHQAFLLQQICHEHNSLSGKVVTAPQNLGREKTKYKTQCI
jgi:hypothetical protein